MSTALSPPYTPQIERWMQHPRTHVPVTDRLAQHNFTNTQHAFLHRPSQPPPTAPSSHTNHQCASSMTRALVHQSPASTSTPSLTSTFQTTGSQTASTAGSARTSLASHGVLAAQRVLSEVDGVLTAPVSAPAAAASAAPEHTCVFHFLACTYVSRDPDEWTRHCTAHLRGQPPPRRVACPLCPWSADCEGEEEGGAAWHRGLRHVSEVHFAAGHGLGGERVDGELARWLWQRRLIGGEDLKVLLGADCGGRHGARAEGRFVVTNGRERRGRGQRVQHVSQRLVR
jgi:hypothetical protein